LLYNACGYAWRYQIGELCIPLLRLNALQLDLIARVVEAAPHSAQFSSDVNKANSDKVSSPNVVSKAINATVEG
jgi:hypothetical protein